MSDVDWTPGDRIELEGRRGKLVDVEEFGGLTYLEVYIDGEGTKKVALEDVEIEPLERETTFGDDIPIDALHPHHEAVSAERFDLRTQAFQLQLAHERGQLLSISSSLVQLEPYQLECVNEVMSKLRQRVLIADDVGLGKTIEAGLILKELEARRRADRVLLVVPAHLQKKWVRDMERFFDLDLTVADRAWVEGERRRLGEDANIWTRDDQRLITSMAFLRQDEFDDALEEAFWDVVVVDECHKASKRDDDPSKTSKRVEQVCHHSDALLLLSATPHDGKERAFRSLIGYIDPFRVAPDQELDRETIDDLMIRRGKETILDEDGERIFPDRDVKTIEVEPSPPEEELYEAVTEYVRELYNRSAHLNEPVVGFAMALMQKRLVSSVGAIRETLRRRLEGLLDRDELSLSADAEAYLAGDDLDEPAREEVERELEQVTLPTGDRDLRREIDALRTIVSMAEELPVDTKTRAVRDYVERLLHEKPDEKLLLFTEYTDTLDYLLDEFADAPWADDILTIHGGVDKEERAEIEKVFNYGRPRLLFATDAASEGIDLQESCHIMINYELPWNPNKLEQRIGRIHRYGQDDEVKVFNFQFGGTREAEIFELLQDKVENIRSKVGNTADVLGMLEGLNVEDLVMESLRSDEPVSVTREELEAELAKRQQTLMEWYDRSLVDCSTFDAESRRKIEEVVDASEDAFGGEEAVERFVCEAIEQLGGEVRHESPRILTFDIPDSMSQALEDVSEAKAYTADRDLASERDELHFLAPDAPLVRRLVEHVTDEQQFGGRVGLKVVPSLDKAGITYVYRAAFEDGTGEVLREELIAVHVDPHARDPRRDLGEEVRTADSLRAHPDPDLVEQLVEAEPQLREAAEQYVGHVVRQTRQSLRDERETQSRRELEQLDSYFDSESSRLQSFIEEYEQEQEEAGRDMDISIKRQRYRLERLQERIDERKENVRQKGRVISLAPELVGYCLAVSN